MAFAIMAALGASASAQEAQQGSGTSSSDQGGLQEIIVTAQRRAEGVLSVPDSVQAETGVALNNEGIVNLTDLQFVTPGYFSFSSAGFTQIYIRGVGNDIFTGADPSVATFVDDVPRPYGTLNANFFDVERVEVLKGAQGGLYGRNATGGVVNILTQQPNTASFDGNGLIDYGEKNTLRVAGYVNLPVNDMIAVSLAGERDVHDGYVNNVAPANPYTAAMFPTGSFLGSPQQTANALNAGVHPIQDLGNQDYWAADGKILFKPIETFKITFAADFNNKSDNYGNQNIQVNPALTQAYLTGTLEAFGFNPHLPAGFIPEASGKFSAALGDPILVNTKDWGESATAVWNGPGVDVTSITANRRQDSEDLVGSFGSSVPIATAYVVNRREFYYQELRAISTWDSPFHILGGGTFLQNDLRSGLSIGLLGGIAAAAPVQSTDVVHNASVYAQIGYDITHDLTFTVSGRYIHEINHASFTEPTVSGSTSAEDKFLPAATLSYKLPDGVAYLRWAEGFKAGGVNPTAAPAYFPNPNSGSIFGPETVQTYEVGYREAVLDRKLQLTSAVFYNDYKNLQYSDHANAQYASTIILAIVNGGSARTWGAEETLDYQVANPVVLGVSAGYLNAKYINFTLQNNPVLADFNLSGQQMVNAPKWQLNLHGNLDQPLTNNFHLVASVVQSYLSSVLFQPSALPGVVPDAVGPAYWITNLRLGVNTSDDKLGVALFARNLFNRAYYVYGGSNVAGNVFTWGDPRIAGVEFTARF